jgi:hypothetical protein
MPLKKLTESVNALNEGEYLWPCGGSATPKNENKNQGMTKPLLMAIGVV